MLMDIVLAALLAAPQSLGIHPGATATVQVTGATGPLTVTPSASITNATVDQTTGTVTVQAGQILGAATLHVVDGSGATLDIPVLVAPDAAVVPASLSLRLTGNPMDAGWLATQIAQAVTRAVALQPGVIMQVGTVVPPPTLAPGSTASLAVPVSVDGKGTYLNVATRTNVDVTNVAETPLAPPLLFYDDDPEHLSADGVAFQQNVSAAEPARLYVYHDDKGDPHRVVVVLRASVPTTVQIIDASAGPNIDVLSVGHAVTRTFLAQKGRNEGTIVDIAPNAPFIMHDIRETDKQLIAQAIEFNVLQGGPLSVSVLSASPGVDPLSLLDGPMLPPDGHHRTGVFSITNFGTDSLAYTVGGPDVSAKFGNKNDTPPNTDPKSNGVDYGDYGVIHTFLFNVSNPSNDAETVYLFERPAGGYVRSSFLVNGNLIDVGCVRESSTRYQIGAFSLAPRQRYLFNVQTMTEGGSNYPLEVGMTTTAPQPTAPPMSAPDGCFPKQ